MEQPAFRSPDAWSLVWMTVTNGRMSSKNESNLTAQLLNRLIGNRGIILIVPKGLLPKRLLMRGFVQQCVPTPSPHYLAIIALQFL